MLMGSSPTPRKRWYTPFLTFFGLGQQSAASSSNEVAHDPQLSSALAQAHALINNIKCSTGGVFFDIGNTAMRMYCKEGNLYEVQNCLRFEGIQNTAHLPSNEALKIAVESEQLEIVQLLLQLSNVKNNISPLEGSAMLIYAVLKGDSALVTELLKAPTINYQVTAYDNLAFYLAVALNHPETAEILYQISHVKTSLAECPAQTRGHPIMEKMLHAISTDISRTPSSSPCSLAKVKREAPEGGPLQDNNPKPKKAQRYQNDSIYSAALFSDPIELPADYRLSCPCPCSSSGPSSDPSSKNETQSRPKRTRKR